MILDILLAFFATSHCEGVIDSTGCSAHAGKQIFFYRKKETTAMPSSFQRNQRLHVGAAENS